MPSPLRVAATITTLRPALRRLTVATTLGVVCLTLSSSPASAQAPPPLAGAALNHVGLAVRDIDQSARAYAQVFGVPVPAISTVTVDAPGGRKVTFRIAQVTLPNFRIDLGQGIGPDNPFSAFVAKYGDGIQHLGFAVPDRLAERTAGLVATGGTQTLGKTGDPFAFVDMTGLLGTTVELSLQGAAAARPAPPGTASATTPAAPTRLSQAEVSHVGLILKDVDRTSKAFHELLGLPAPQFINARGIDFPAGYTGDKSVGVRISMVKAGTVGLELQQTPGVSSPWHDSFLRLGDGVEHVAFTIKGDLDAMRAHLATGGPEVLGGEGSRYPHFEYAKTLGLMIELLGTPTRPRP